MGSSIRAELSSRLVTVAAVVAGFLVTESTVIAIGLGLLAAGIYRLLVPPPKSRVKPHLRSQPRGPGQPFRWEFVVPSRLGSVSEVTDLLVAANLSLKSHTPSRAVLESGSQLATRLKGGHFVAPATLPLTVTVGADSDHEGARIAVEDRLGRITVRDQAFEARYALRAAEIAGITEAGSAPA
jgi:hypothetical protein